MIGVVFEVWIKKEHKADYLKMAAEMRNLIEKIDGFISVERFQSLVDDEKLVSISFFESHDALDAWRIIVPACCIVGMLFYADGNQP